MLLTEPEIQQVLEQVQAAFPNLTDWEYNNEKNDEYFGFSVWGQFLINSELLYQIIKTIQDKGFQPILQVFTCISVSCLFVCNAPFFLA